MNDAAKPTTKRVHVEIDADIHQLMRLQSVTEKKTIRHCFYEDNVDFVSKIRNIIIENGENPDKVIGMVLSDPNGTSVPIDALSELSVSVPRLDIAIHWNSAAFKRARGAFGVDRPTLELALSKIKKEHWFIRKPI